MTQPKKSASSNGKTGSKAGGDQEASNRQSGTPQHKTSFRLLAALGAAVAVIAIFAAVFASSWAGKDATKQHGSEELDEWATPSVASDSAVEQAARAAGLDLNLWEPDFAGVEVEPKVLSQEPRIYLFEDLLSPMECDFLTNLVNGRLKPAGVVLETKDKHTVQTESRNNEQIWITPDEEKNIPLLRHILRRMHRVARIPDTDAEALQIGRYESMQKYESHLDTDPGHDVERPATLLTYLSDVESGGDTLFPLNQRSECSSRWHKDANGNRVFGCAKCCDAHLPGTIQVRPKKGSAILFFNHKLDGSVDPLAEHAACPVKTGTKWIAQRWFRLAPYQNIKFPIDARFDGLPQPHAAVPADAVKSWDGRIRQLSRKSPRVHLMEAFLSHEECDYLVSLAQQLEERKDASATARMWSISVDVENTDPVVSRVAKRLHRAAYVPEFHAEALQLASTSADAGAAAAEVLRHDGNGPAGARTATFVIFLSDVEGGEVVLPRASKCTSIEDCCAKTDGRKPLRIPARKGHAVLLYLRTVQGTKPDAAAVYGACPVRHGTKWTLQRWFTVQRSDFATSHAPDPVYDKVFP